MLAHKHVFMFNKIRCNESDLTHGFSLVKKYVSVKLYQIFLQFFYLNLLANKVYYVDINLLHKNLYAKIK